MHLPSILFLNAQLFPLILTAVPLLQVSGMALSLCQVRLAEAHGALGVILYSDPADYANNQSVVYPDSWWLPGWAVQLAHVRYELVGDPLTPEYSSISKSIVQYWF